MSNKVICLSNINGRKFLKTSRLRECVLDLVVSKNLMGPLLRPNVDPDDFAYDILYKPKNPDELCFLEPELDIDFNAFEIEIWRMVSDYELLSIIVPTYDMNMARLQNIILEECVMLCLQDIADEMKSDRKLRVVN